MKEEYWNVQDLELKDREKCLIMICKFYEISNSPNNIKWLLYNHYALSNNIVPHPEFAYDVLMLRDQVRKFFYYRGNIEINLNINLTNEEKAIIIHYVSCEYDNIYQEELCNFIGTKLVNQLNLNWEELIKKQEETIKLDKSFNLLKTLYPNWFENKYKQKFIF